MASHYSVWNTMINSTTPTTSAYQYKKSNNCLSSNSVTQYILQFAILTQYGRGGLSMRVPSRELQRSFGVNAVQKSRY
jgi:hypothetical protein